MRLSEKINSIPSDYPISELNQILEKKVQVSISWFGKRVVSIEGFEGTVTIDSIGKKYLNSSFSQKNRGWNKDIDTASLKERLGYYDLWGRVEKLYSDGDAVLGKTWIYKYLVWMLEFSPYCRHCAGDPAAIIGMGLDREKAFEFSKEKFYEYWPERRFDCITVGEPSSEDDWLDRTRTATREQIEAAITKLGKSISA